MVASRNRTEARREKRRRRDRKRKRKRNKYKLQERVDRLTEWILELQKAGYEMAWKTRRRSYGAPANGVIIAHGRRSVIVRVDVTKKNKEWCVEYRRRHFSDTEERWYGHLNQVKYAVWPFLYQRLGP